MTEVDKTYLRQILDDERTQIHSMLKSDAHFEVFSAEQLLKKYELDHIEIESGLVDGGNDGGIDAIYCLANRQLIREDTVHPKRQEGVNIDLIIITARSGGGSFDTDPLNKLIATADDLLDPSKSLSGKEKLYNQRLLDTIRGFHKLYLALRRFHPNLNVSFNYVTMGEEISVHVESLRTKLANRINELYSPQGCEVRLIGAKGLLNLFDQRPPTTLELKTIKLMPVGTDAHIALAKLSDFYSFITDSDKELMRRIFESNVRDYQGNVKVNRDIRTTLESGSAAREEFWWLNNGITIIASDVKGHGETLVIDDPQIVNGLQTSREIYQYFRSNNSPEDDRCVLIRVIKTDDSTTRDTIIRATNSQTSIPSPWLHATEEVHRRIEQYLRGSDLYYERRKNFYKNQGKPTDRIVTIPWLAQAIMAIALGRPDNARARPSTVLQKNYRQVFSPHYSPELYLHCACLMKRVELYLQSKNIAKTTENNIEFHVAMYVSVLALKKLDPTWQMVANLNPGKIADSVFEDSYQRVYRKYKQLGKNDKVAKGPKFVEQIRKELARRLAQG